MPRIVSIVLIAVLCSCALQLTGQASIGADGLRWKSADRGSTPDIDPEVYLVLTGGCWRRAEAQGRYRLIVVEGGFEEVFHLVYVQLMAVDLDRGRETIAKTTPIAETHDGQYLVTLRDVTLARSDAGQCGDAVFEGDIVRRTREDLISERRFRLQVHPEGNYAWSETAVPGHTSSARESGKQRSGSED